MLADARSLLRRPGRSGWIAIAAIALFALIGIGGPLVGHGAFAGTDELQYFAPWAYEVQPTNLPDAAPLGDTFQQYIPSANEAASRLRDGDIAWTSPYEDGSTGLASWLGDGLANPMYLPWLVLPASMAPGYTKLLEIIVAVGLTYLFCRRVGIGRAAAWIGGLAYAASGFQIAWTNWPQPRVGAVTPGIFWAIERLIQRRRIGDVALLAVFVGWSFGAGFPAVTLMALTVGACYTVFRVVQECGPRPRELIRLTATAIGALALGLALTALQLVGLLHVLGMSDISNRATGLGSTSNIRELATALLPGGLGLPELGGRPPGPSNIVEMQTYVGGAVAVLALGLIVRRRTPTERRGVALFFLVLTAASLVMLFHGGLLLEIVQRGVPKLKDNYFGRWRSILGWSVAMLAAFGADRWGTASSRRVGRSRWWYWGAAAFVVAAVTAFEIRAIRPVTDINRRSVDRGVLVLGLALAATVVLLFLVRKRPRLGIGVIAPIIALEALAFVLPYWHRSPDRWFYPSSPVITATQEVIGSDRVEPIEATAGTLSWYRVRTATGYYPATREWSELLDAVNPTLLRTDWMTNVGTVDQALAGSNVLDRFGVRYLLLGRPAVPEVMPAGWTELAESPGGVLVQRPTALPRIRWASTSQVVAPADQVAALVVGVPADVVVLDQPSGAAEGGNGTVTSVEEVDSDERTYKVSADGPGYLVVADAYDTWWSVTVDGHEVDPLRADHAMMAVPLGAGDHTVHFSYRVTRAGAGVSFGAVAIVVALVVVEVVVVRRRRRVGGLSAADGDDTDQGLTTSNPSDSATGI